MSIIRSLDFSFSRLVSFRSHYAPENHDLTDNSQKLKQVSNAAKSGSPFAAVEACVNIIEAFLSLKCQSVETFARLIKKEPSRLGKATYCVY